MRTIGIIGGMSWESTVTYYQVINEVVRRELGGLHSARILLYSIDFAELEACQREGDWEAAGALMADAAAILERGGADFVVIGANTMHRSVPQIEARVDIPVLHIADVTADALVAAGIDRVALLGTRFTMAPGYYREHLAARGIETLVPEGDDAAFVDHVIYDELCMGIISPESKETLLRIVADLAARGAQGVILGCTEIGLLIQQTDMELPVFDTTLIHAEQAALRLLEREGSAHRHPYPGPTQGPRV